MMIQAVFVISGLILGILISVEMGYRFGLWRWMRMPDIERSLSAPIEASIFGLMGLLIGFTFYGAGSRFDVRRQLIAEEANVTGTAYRRIDLLPPEAQPELRVHFRNYVRARIAVFQKLPDWSAVQPELARAASLQNKIWDEAVKACQSSGPAVQSLVLASLNQMIDITTIRSVALITHPPTAVFLMLAVSAIAWSVLMGYSISISGVRDRIHIIAFALVLGSALYVIIDYEYPRIGLVREDPVDQVMLETLEQMR